MAYSVIRLLRMASEAKLVRAARAQALSLTLVTISLAPVQEEPYIHRPWLISAWPFIPLS